MSAYGCFKSALVATPHAVRAHSAGCADRRNRKTVRRSLRTASASCLRQHLRRAASTAFSRRITAFSSAMMPATCRRTDVGL